MIDRERALAIASSWADRYSSPDRKARIREDDVREYDFGWIFTWDYDGGGAEGLLAQVPGKAPFIVERAEGTVHVIPPRPNQVNRFIEDFGSRFRERMEGKEPPVTQGQ